MFQKDEVVELLKENVCIVDFNKVSTGEKRIMECTLNANMIPPAEGESTRTKKTNDEVVSVWCVDKGAWRSFRLNTVNSIVVKGEEVE